MSLSACPFPPKTVLDLAATAKAGFDITAPHDVPIRMHFSDTKRPLNLKHRGGAQAMLVMTVNNETMTTTMSTLDNLRQLGHLGIRLCVAALAGKRRSEPVVS